MPDVVKGCLSKRKRIVGQEVGKMGRVNSWEGYRQGFGLYPWG